MYTHPAAGWHIRRLRQDDYRACMLLLRDCIADFPWRGAPAPYLRQLFNSLPTAEKFVAVEARAGVIGFLTMRPENAYVDHVFVHRDWRLCGVGRGLLEVAAKRARGPLKLDVDAQNVQARRAYAALGWRDLEHAGARKRHQIRLVGP